MTTSNLASPLDLHQRYAVAEALQYLRISRAHFYNRVNTGALTVIQDGRRTYVTGREIARYSGAQL